MTIHYQTKGHIKISRADLDLPYENAIEHLIDELDQSRGALFTSNYEYPGRYARWDIGFIHPPLAISSQGLHFIIDALNQRGEVLLKILNTFLEKTDFTDNYQFDSQQISGDIKPSTDYFSEEERSKQNSIFSLLRFIIDIFYSTEDAHLGLYGAFAYDLVFQFEKLNHKLIRENDQRDLVLYLPDEIYMVDHQREHAKKLIYEFEFERFQTFTLAHTGEQAEISIEHDQKLEQDADHKPGEYAESVKEAKKAFKCGDLFEVVLSQTLYRKTNAKPSEIFKRLRQRNPAPYASLINLGESEYLVGASPEMFVRVTGKRVETCPISGTIARGQDAISDATQILVLLNSEKDESELTMCTDVDRNDKSRICEPGSVRVIGRRQIEMYSRVIHTVDHIEGQLREGFDALDAFLSHTWVVTVTGAPKVWAMQFIENHEKTPRRWYGGAIGWLQFNGDINTGLTLRTMRIQNRIAEVRVGATLLYDSDPAAEEEETLLKASAFLEAIKNPIQVKTDQDGFLKEKIGSKKKILLVDHQDSFVHTLANYLRQTGAEVITLRSGFKLDKLKEIKPDLVCLSPGPGCPDDFKVSETIKNSLSLNLPIFGVCLGLQALVEYYGGQLDVLDYPMHGKPEKIHVLGGKCFTDLPKSFTAARYHSLYAKPETFPSDLEITAESSDGIIMAIEHKTLPIAAVQFHPESILTLENNAGLRIIFNVLRYFS
ncbi:MAG: anthranilate synthase component I [Gammaproteobacteria bacterium]